MSNKQPKRLIVIDSLSNYLRHFVCNPSLSDNGIPVGGIVGFIKDLNKFCREFKPDLIIVCWDGEGGSSKRKSIVKEYKEGRKPIRLNRSNSQLTEQEDADNRVYQQIRLIEYLNTMPVIQFRFQNTEADDIISELATMPAFKTWDTVVISSDHDFYQLCNDHVLLYRPIQKHFVNLPRVLDEYHIHPSNFALARAIAGDSSDNLKGVGGVGLPTVAKRFPEFESEESVTFEKLWELCEERKDAAKCYSTILENKDTVRTNYKMMQLYCSSMSIQDKLQLRQTLTDYVPSFGKLEFTKLGIQDGLGTVSLDNMFATFNSMVFNGSPISM